MKCSIKKRELPPSPPTATKTVRNDFIYGFGRHTYEYNEAAPALDLQIPPTKSNSKAAQAEREMKIILDLARQGKTASQIAEEAGCNRNRVTQVVKQFQEYGAKLAPEPKKKKKRAFSTTSAIWTEDKVNKLIELHRRGLSFSEIGKELGVSKNSVASKVRALVEAGVLRPRTEQFSWPQEDVDRMFQLRAEGKTWGEISDKLGRKITACHNKYCKEMEKRKCRKGVAAIIFFFAWLLCGCCVETVVDHPSAGIVFLIALVVCIVVAIFMDRTDL